GPGSRTGRLTAARRRSSSCGEPFSSLVRYSRREARGRSHGIRRRRFAGSPCRRPRGAWSRRERPSRRRARSATNKEASGCADKASSHPPDVASKRLRLLRFPKAAGAQTTFETMRARGAASMAQPARSEKPEMLFPNNLSVTGCSVSRLRLGVWKRLAIHLNLFEQAALVLHV